MLICTGSEKSGRIVKRYLIKNTENGNEIWINKDEMIKHIENNEIANATIQWWQGSPIVRVKEKQVVVEAKHKEVSEKAKTIINEQVTYGSEAVEKLKSIEKGTPVVVRMNGNYKQTIFIKRTVTDNGMEGTMLFDDNGINGTFTFTDKFIESKDKEFLSFIINKAIPEETARLLNAIKRYQAK